MPAFTYGGDLDLTLICAFDLFDLDLALMCACKCIGYTCASEHYVMDGP